jgi:hypothetical protein
VRAGDVVVVVVSSAAIPVTSVSAVAAIVGVRSLIVAAGWSLLTPGPIGRSNGGIAKGMTHGVRSA